jgi:hypothetical protein
MMLLALMMVCASIAAWIIAGAAAQGARSYIRLASILFSAFGIAAAVDATLANTVGLIAAAIGPALLVLAMLDARPFPQLFASLALAAAAASGIAAAAVNVMALALAPLIVSVAVMAGCAIRGWRIGPGRAAQALAAALSFLAGACAFVSGDLIALMALLLFSSAGLLGVSLSLARDSDAAIEQHGAPDLRGRAIG